MALSAFGDKAKKPGASALEGVLGRASTHWNGLRARIAAEHAPVDETWGFAGAKWGWSLRLKRKKRTILYMTPCKGHFLVGLVLGEKAVEAARSSRLPASTLELIDQARKYAEGRGLRLEVRNERDLRTAEKLAAIKMKN